MGSPNGSNDTTHTPPPLSFYNTFKSTGSAVSFPPRIQYFLIWFIFQICEECKSVFLFLEQSLISAIGSKFVLKQWVQTSALYIAGTIYSNKEDKVSRIWHLMVYHSEADLIWLDGPFSGNWFCNTHRSPSDFALTSAKLITSPRSTPT
jgi:hypothetical protein